MIIDWHTHLHPPEYAAKPFWQGRCPMTIENVLAAQDEAGIDMTVVSNAAHELRQLNREQQFEMVCTINRYLAEQQGKYPDKIIAFATSAPTGGDRFLKELERAVVEDGMKGVWVTSSLQGDYPDDDAARPFFKLVNDLGIPVVIHPPSIGFGEERMNVYRLASSVGRPFDNALAIARLIVRGIFEELPDLKLVGSHLGGGICEIIGRLDYAYELQDEAFFLGSYEPMLIRHPPSHYLKMMYLDLVCYHAPAARCGIETIGADHILLGTDAPPLTVLKPRGLKMVDELGLNAADKEKVLSGNARKLLNLD
jgi:aminocarboxymuconate-semialdehyde decarboxylase